MVPQTLQITFHIILFLFFGHNKLDKNASQSLNKYINKKHKSFTFNKLTKTKTPFIRQKHKS